MKKYNLYVGLNDKDTKTQLVDYSNAQIEATNIVMKYCDGATISDAIGVYRHNDGTLITEKTLKIELLFITKALVRKISNELKRHFNQETIAVEEREVNSQLI